MAAEAKIIFFCQEQPSLAKRINNTKNWTRDHVETLIPPCIGNNPSHETPINVSHVAQLSIFMGMDAFSTPILLNIFNRI